MIYCGCPKSWARAVRPARAAYYNDDPNVKVIVDRRRERAPRRRGAHARTAATVRDRRRPRVSWASSPAIDGDRESCSSSSTSTAERAATRVPPRRPRCSRARRDDVDEATEVLGRHQQRGRVPRPAAGPGPGPCAGRHEVDVVNDSELVARQVNGEYKVHHAGMKPLHAEARRRWRASRAGRSVPSRGRRTRRRRPGQPGARRRALTRGRRRGSGKAARCRYGEHVAR